MLTLDKKNKKIAGVCAGLAKWMDVDATMLRIFFILTTLYLGCGIPLYLFLWIVIPLADFE